MIIRSGIRLHIYGQIHHAFLMDKYDKSTISTGPFSSTQTVCLPEGNY